jgi:hypothetical protein
MQWIRWPSVMAAASRAREEKERTTREEKGKAVAAVAKSGLGLVPVEEVELHGPLSGP